MRILIFKKVSTTILCQNLKNLVRVEFEENSVFAKKKNGQNGPEMVLIFHHKPLSGKIVVFKLWAKMFFVNQIAGFFTMSQEKK